MNQKIPTRRMREHPNLEQFKRQAKDLVGRFVAGDPEARGRSAHIIAERMLRSSHCMTHSLCWPEAMDLRAGPR